MPLTSKQTSELQAKLLVAIEGSLAEFRERFPDAHLACYALVTDEDLRTLYGAACTKEQLAGFPRPDYQFRPAEWAVEIHEPFQEASALLGALADAEYALEGPDVGPEDVRPWKANLYQCLANALQEHRRGGRFDEDVFLIATSHTPDEWLEGQIDAASRALNPPRKTSKPSTNLRLRLDFDEPGKRGQLLVGFEKIPKEFVRKGLGAGIPPPLNFRAKYARRPLVMFLNIESFPSGRFDESIAGARKVKPTPEQVVGFTQYVENWMSEIDRTAPIVAAWGWSGEHSELPPDPAFATAWLDVVESLGTVTDGVVDREPEKLLKRVVSELPDAERERANAVLATRRKAWKGRL